MPKVYSSALQETLEINRIIGHLQGDQNGPTLVFFAGIHGNEPAGVFALKHVLRELKVQQVTIQGNLYAIAGNLEALSNNVRFQNRDLNRIWTVEGIEEIQKLKNPKKDEKELIALHSLLKEILANCRPPFYFIDLHTTSSDTSPFMVLNDSLLNRKFASNYPLPIILGIEEYLGGALLSYINELGYVSLGYESGSHDDIKSIKNCIDFIWYTLGITQIVQLPLKELEAVKEEIEKYSTISRRFYEIYYQYKISRNDSFSMRPGFNNFQKVPKGKELADRDGEVVVTSRKRQIFMPLYQSLGSEGFYFIRPIPKLLLWLSKKLRKYRVDHLLIWLPGVQWKSVTKDVMIVDQRIARFLAKSFFHLLGYRTRKFDHTHLVVKSRESASKHSEYLDTNWY